ncbi:PspC domain-containing protein [Secundilactobacillus kimchicus]|uniref:PspC domain-containing protein n=1 Tax=Secundilactobacillus kimchicus TaxID=528209 RepID=UPI0024A84609|nr:PspC domain-containing protein [Secundilactobacillus kimchicus]
MTKIKRSSSNRIIAGVLGGIATHFNWSANTLRLVWVVLTMTPFPGLIVYVLLWLLLPAE